MSGTCDVSIGGWDGDTAVCYTESFVAARKVHQCYECQEPIVKGQRYQRVSGLWDGEWSTYRFCLPCVEVGGEFSEDGRVFGSLWDEMQEAWASGAHVTACIQRLSSVAAKEHLRQRWMEWKGLV